ncbi:MAG: helix-turn-helix transcriptional regulator [Pyrinomonadaceae bacterium]
MEFIKSSFHQDITLTCMARTVGISTSRLRHLFKEQVNLTPSQFLMNYRMAKAKELLTTTGLSVKEVMVAVGVSDPSNFTRYFKRHFGTTPTELRNLSQRRNFEQPGSAVPCHRAAASGPGNSRQAVASVLSWHERPPARGSVTGASGSPA